jgi:hypothetical protein
MATFVLVPGAWHGGWWFELLARRLRRHSREAYPLILTGIGDRNPLLTASVNLDTHPGRRKCAGGRADRRRGAGRPQLEWDGDHRGRRPRSGARRSRASSR